MIWLARTWSEKMPSSRCSDMMFVSTTSSRVDGPCSSYDNLYRDVRIVEPSHAAKRRVRAGFPTPDLCTAAPGCRCSKSGGEGALLLLASYMVSCDSWPSTGAAGPLHPGPRRPCDNFRREGRGQRRGDRVVPARSPLYPSYSTSS